MHLMDERLLGIAVLLLLAALVVLKRISTGSLVDIPRGRPFLRLVNLFNLFFLLVVNPAAGLLLVFSSATVDSTRLVIDGSATRIVVETIGSVLYVVGYIVMAWALIAMGRHYQLAGTAPRPSDDMVVRGPYRTMRHPMYAAALSISLGLACLTQSWVLICVFGIYVALILLLIPDEENGLRAVYGERYVSYQQHARRLIPFVY